MLGMKCALCWMFGLSLVTIICLSGCARATVEQPAYTTVRTGANYEIRSYPLLKLATAPMGEDKGRNGSFMKLFRYIQGENEGGKKIAMTSPVLIDRSDKKTMGFIVPKEVAAGDVPSPKREDVRLDSLPAGQFAALRFPGVQDVEAERKALATLQAALAKDGIATTGEPLFAYYDPPWTPTPLRRNEVLLRLKAPLPANAQP